MCFWEFNIDLRKKPRFKQRLYRREEKLTFQSLLNATSILQRKHCNLTIIRRFGSWPTNLNNPAMSLTRVTWDGHRAGRKAVTRECKARAGSRHLCVPKSHPPSPLALAGRVPGIPVHHAAGLTSSKELADQWVPKIWCPSFTWADTKLSRGTENTSGVKTLLSLTPFSQQRISQPFVFMVGYFHKS